MRDQTVQLALIAPPHHRPAIRGDPGISKGERPHIAHSQDKIIIGERIHWPIRPDTRAGQDHGADERMGRPPRHQLVNNFLLLRDIHHLVFLNLCVMGEMNAAHPANRSNDLWTSHHVTWPGYSSTSFISFLVFHFTTIPAEVSPLN